ncbi:hypothetical protein KU6B_13420 [Mameliella alba]|uniref:hypothetical protein n=1 Tax=Mameliella alba TaxID=561184 RepID=UPI0013E4317A|nr:hypothetical protein [Mameliella alba]BBU55077.1 hypothetical protein KU6B_13420 [Mameliella alba]
MKSILTAAAVALGLAQPLAAQDFPTGPVTIIVPYSPSGNTDVFTRHLAPISKRNGASRSSSTTAPAAGRWWARPSSPKQSRTATRCW